MLVDFTKPVRKSELLHRVICKDSLVTLPPHASIFEATQLMADKDCGAVGIVDRGRFIGLLTERDIISDVIAKGRNPKKVKVSTVMQRQPISIDISQNANDALHMVTAAEHRYLPVTQSGQLVGLLDIVDLYEEIQRVLENSLEEQSALLSYAFHEPYCSPLPGFAAYTQNKGQTQAKQPEHI